MDNWGLWIEKGIQPMGRIAPSGTSFVYWKRKEERLGGEKRIKGEG
jgi:hypothetical protein